MDWTDVNVAWIPKSHSEFVQILLTPTFLHLQVTPSKICFDFFFNFQGKTSNHPNAWCYAPASFQIFGLQTKRYLSLYYKRFKDVSHI